MKTYRLLNTAVAKLYINYLLDHGFSFDVTPWTSHVQIDVHAEVLGQADQPLTEWQSTHLEQI
jgi:hypothetical protein